MPIYVYSCPCCAHVVEVLQKLDEPPPWCSVCASEEHPPANMLKVPAAASFEISGEGVYKPGFSRAK